MSVRSALASSPPPLCAGGHGGLVTHSGGRDTAAPGMERCLWVCRSHAAPPATGLLTCTWHMET